MSDQLKESEAKYEQFNTELDRFRKDVLYSRSFSPEKKRSVFGTLFMLYVKLEGSPKKLEIDLKMKGLMDDFGTLTATEDTSRCCAHCRGLVPIADDED